ncbi:Protein of unknown function [Gryllus bimaculatus]|nr:Protein of unknown function [Gryllus bimaculatus]
MVVTAPVAAAKAQAAVGGSRAAALNNPVDAGRRRSFRVTCSNPRRYYSLLGRARTCVALGGESQRVTAVQRDAMRLQQRRQPMIGRVRRRQADEGLWKVPSTAQAHEY